MPEHLTTDQIAAYLERRIPESERDAVEAHLFRCSRCRDELAEASGVLRGGRGPASWKVMVPVAAAAALIGLFSLGVPPFGGGPVLEDPIRSERVGRTEAVTTIPAISPADEATLGPGGLIFRWRSAGDEAVYAFTLADPEGSPVWSVSVPDTVVAVPDEVVAGLASGTTYFWSVDAALVNGRSARTDVRAFTYTARAPQP